MSMSPTHTNAITSFPVVITNTSGEIFTLVVTDADNLLSSTKMVRGVLLDAIRQWVAASTEAQLITNGDQSFVDWANYAGGENAVTDASVVWDMADKTCTVTLTATTNVSVANVTATAPFASVYS